MKRADFSGNQTVTVENPLGQIVASKIEIFLNVIAMM